MDYSYYDFAERFKIPKQRNIKMVRGDTLAFAIRLLNIVNEPENVYFSCHAKNLEDYIFNKSFDNGVVPPIFEEVEALPAQQSSSVHYYLMYNPSLMADSDLSKNTIYILTNLERKYVRWTGESIGDAHELKDEKSLFYKIRVAPEDTKNTEPGEYIWDLQVSGDGDVFTIAGGTLTILPEATTI